MNTCDGSQSFTWSFACHAKLGELRHLRELGTSAAFPSFKWLLCRRAELPIPPILPLTIVPRCLFSLHHPAPQQRVEAMPDKHWALQREHSRVFLLSPQIAMVLKMSLSSFRLLWCLWAPASSFDQFVPGLSTVTLS